MIINYWCAGQDDNLGDVVLRRRMLESLQSLGPCRVYVGSASSSFVSALRLRDEDQSVTSFPLFLFHALVTSMRRHWLFAFNPGEVTANRKQSLMHGAVLPVLLISKIRGSRVVRVGVGMHPSRSRWDVLIAASVWLTGMNIWRDEASQSRYGLGGVAPDWAFGISPMISAANPDSVRSESGRKFIAVSFRGDLPAPSCGFLEALVVTASEQQKDLIVVVQVKRDSASSRLLAQRLNCQILDWTAASHAEQEDRVLSIYANSAAVVSDRLHALVLGVAHGCIPLGFMEHSVNKISRHFDAAGFPVISADVSGWDTPEIIQAMTNILGKGEEVQRSARRAFESVAKLDEWGVVR